MSALTHALMAELIPGSRAERSRITASAPVFLERKRWQMLQ